MKIFIKKAIFTILFFATCLCMFGQQNASVAFFGIYSPDADKNMLSMTEDLYFKQNKKGNHKAFFYTHFTYFPKNRLLFRLYLGFKYIIC